MANAKANYTTNEIKGNAQRMREKVDRKGREKKSYTAMAKAAPHHEKGNMD